MCSAKTKPRTHEGLHGVEAGPSTVPVDAREKSDAMAETRLFQSQTLCTRNALTTL